MISIVRILPEVEGEPELNTVNKQRKHANSHPGKNGRNHYLAQRNFVHVGYTLSSEPYREEIQNTERKPTSEGHSLSIKRDVGEQVRT
jgi:hypothetical protein